MARHSVDVVVRAHDKASRQFGRIGKSAVGMGQMLKSAIVMAGMYLGVRQIASLIKYGAAFEKTMSRVGALANAVADDQKRLTDTAKKLGETTVFTATQVAEGMSFLALAGFEVNEIIASMPATLNLAAAGQLELAQAADITAKIMRGMGLSSDELGSAVDVLAQAFTSSNTNLVQLGEAMQYVGPLGRTAGKSLEELTSAIQLMSDAGIQGSMAGTSLRQILGALSGATPVATEGLEKLGIITVDSTGKLKPLADIIEQFNNKMKDMGKAERIAVLMQIFGKRAGPGMAAMLNEGAVALREYENSLKESTGRAREVAEKQLDNVAGDLTKIASVASGIVIGVFQKSSGWLRGYLKNFREGLIIIGVGIDNFGLLMKMVGNYVKLAAVGIWEDMKHFFGTVIPDLLMWFGRNWREIFTDIWNATKAIFTNMWTNITDFFTAVWSWLKGEGFDFKWTGLLEGFESTLKELPKIAKRELTDLEKELSAAIETQKLEFAKKIGEAFEEVVEPVTKGVVKVSLDEESKELLKDKGKAAKRAGLAPMEARFLTFAPGTRFNRTEKNTGDTAKSTSRTVKLIEATNKKLDEIKMVFDTTELKLPVSNFS